jgi:hypothetical protein
VIPVLVVVVVLAVVVVGIVAARRGAANVRRRVDDRLAGVTAQRRDKANFYGLGSGGSGQVRGLGTLVLTDDELLFVQFVPDVEVRVPRSAITSVTTDRSYLGKTQGRDLLVVAWTGDEPDQGAWDVPDVAGWQSALAAGS